MDEYRHMRTENSAQSFFLGRIGHFRNGIARHGFTYPVFFLGIDVDTLDQACLPERKDRPIWPWLFSVNGLNLLSISHHSHGPRNGDALGPWIRDILSNAGLPSECSETVTLYTFPRVLGIGFSPASFWLCRDESGKLRAMLAEVNNTFGEHHSYLVSHIDARVIEHSDQLFARKVFHVSPFFPVMGHYQFQVHDSDQGLQVRIKYQDGKGNSLLAYLHGRPQTMTAKGLAIAFVMYPLQTFTVLSRIHWHALLLWRKGVQFHYKPNPPSKEISVERH
jgi:uncharacterized protein